MFFHDIIVGEKLCFEEVELMKQEEILKITQTTYLPGMRVKIIKMDDIQAPPIGTEGTVRGVDDIGSILVTWDNGSKLNVIPGEDIIKII